MERLHLEEQLAGIVLCDRGTLDGLAYWPGDGDGLLSDVGVDLAAELARYQAVIHLRPPVADGGFDHSNPLRVESAEQAGEIDRRIATAWQDHPRRTIIDSATDFATKASRALAAIAAELPDCCDPART
jgi:hypothetical protein